MIPVVALCLHRPSVAELTVSMAELFAVVEGIGDRTTFGIGKDSSRAVGTGLGAGY